MRLFPRPKSLIRQEPSVCSKALYFYKHSANQLASSQLFCFKKGCLENKTIEMSTSWHCVYNKIGLKFQIVGEDFVNFCGLLRKHGLYLKPASQQHMLHQLISVIVSLVFSCFYPLLFVVRNPLRRWSSTSHKWYYVLGLNCCNIRLGRQATSTL